MNMKTKFIYIVRERCDWHNCNSDDFTTAFATEELAKEVFNKKINYLKEFLIKEGTEIIDEYLVSERYPNETRCEKCKYGRYIIITESDDWCSIWIEKIELN